MKKYTITMTVKVDMSSCNEYQLKQLEHNIEYFVDLDSWPEIKSIENVKVEEVHETDTDTEASEEA